MELERNYTKYIFNKIDNNDYEKDFFGKETFLTVSGQLNVETYCCALSKVYTFGPTFRAENSNTSRHLAEFWMIEPEIAFADLKDDMKLAEDCLKYVFSYVLEHGEDDLKFLENREIQAEKQLPQKDRHEHPLCERLRIVVDSEFAHMTYTEVIEALRNSKPSLARPKKRNTVGPCLNLCRVVQITRSGYRF
jgi:asparaginyl-tRNA synthetase